VEYEILTSVDSTLANSFYLLDAPHSSHTLPANPEVAAQVSDSSHNWQDMSDEEAGRLRALLKQFDQRNTDVHAHAAAFKKLLNVVLTKCGWLPEDFDLLKKQNQKHVEFLTKQLFTPRENPAPTQQVTTLHAQHWGALLPYHLFSPQASKTGLPTQQPATSASKYEDCLGLMFAY
jgi:hypothetical protein